MRVVLSEEEVAFGDRCRRFAEEVIAPHCLRFDRENRFPDVIHDEAARRGLLNACFPQALGGGGVTFKAMAEGGLAMARVCPAVTFTMGFNHGALRPVVFAGTAAQQQRFVKEPIEAHRGYTALALTEATVAGSNLMAVDTRAERTAGGWRITGRKCMVGMGTVAQHFVVLCDTRIDGRRAGLSFFVVPRAAGVTVGENTDKLGFRAVPTPEVAFDGVEVDDDHLLGAVGGAEPILTDVLDFIRYGGGIIILGAIEGALLDTLPWLEEREVFGGQCLIATSHVQITIGRIVAQVEALKLLLRRAADLLDRGIPATEETAALKLLASELAVSASRELLQMHGWRGIDASYAIQKRFRDAQQTTIFEGTSQVLDLRFFASFLERARAEA